MNEQMEQEEQTEQAIAFQGTNAMAFTKMIGGGALFVFMLIMTPLLAEKFRVDFSFVLQIGGVFLMCIFLMYSGYESRDPLIFLIFKDRFIYLTNGIETMIYFEDIVDISRLQGNKVYIKYNQDEKEGKPKVYLFNVDFIKEENRLIAIQTLRDEYEKSKVEQEVFA